MLYCRTMKSFTLVCSKRCLHQSNSRTKAWKQSFHDPLITYASFVPDAPDTQPPPVWKALKAAVIAPPQHLNIYYAMFLMHVFRTLDYTVKVKHHLFCYEWMNRFRNESSFMMQWILYNRPLKEIIHFNQIKAGASVLKAKDDLTISSLTAKLMWSR